MARRAPSSILPLASARSRIEVFSPTQPSQQNAAHAQSTISDYHQFNPASCTHSLIGTSLFRKVVHNGPSSEIGSDSMTPKISETWPECRMTVVTPAAVASSAAMSFVAIPPVPRKLPRVDVDTNELLDYVVRKKQGEDAPCCRIFWTSRTTRTGLAS